MISVGNEFPFSCIQFTFHRAANPPLASWCSLWDGQPSKIYILAVHFAWSMYILNFNCVVLNIRAYGRDHFSVNTVAIGISEMAGVFIGMYIVLYTSRRWLWAGVAGIGAGFLGFLAWYIPQGQCKWSKFVIKIKKKFSSFLI